MPTPAVTAILDKIETRLENITTANGYFTTVVKVNRATLSPLQPYDLPAINFWPTELRNERSQYDKDTRTLFVNIEYYDKTRDLNFADQTAKLAFDVITALNRKDSDPEVGDDVDYNLSGAVQDLIFESYTPVIGEGQTPWLGVVVSIRIEYFADWNDMESYAGY